MRKPTMKSTHEFVDYLAGYLGQVRCLKVLSNQALLIADLDERMGVRWSSVINGRCPSPQQRRDALAERLNVADLRQVVWPGVERLLVDLHSLQAYVNALPAYSDSRQGWDVVQHLEHPRTAIDLMNRCVASLKALRALDESERFLHALWDQLMLVTRWSRQSINPEPPERARVNFGVVTLQQMDATATGLLQKFCTGFHDFCELYADFPVLEPPVRMNIEPLEGFRKE
jgi:hypothetical protein